MNEHFSSGFLPVNFFWKIEDLLPQCCSKTTFGCFQKYGHPKTDGENNGSKPYFQMDDLGGKLTYFWFNTHFLLWLIFFLQSTLRKLDTFEKVKKAIDEMKARLVICQFVETVWPLRIWNTWVLVRI